MNLIPPVRRVRWSWNNSGCVTFGGSASFPYCPEAREPRASASSLGPFLWERKSYARVDPLLPAIAPLGAGRKPPRLVAPATDNTGAVLAASCRCGCSALRFWQKPIRANELALPSSGVAGQYHSLSKINGCVTSAVPSRRSTCFPIRCHLEKVE